MHTDASHRIERGVDYNLARDAMERATELLVSIVGGEPGEIVDVTSAEHLPKPISIVLREKRLADVLGLAIANAKVENILTRLGLR